MKPLNETDKTFILNIMRAAAPFLELQPTTDEELIGMWQQMDDDERQMLFNAYGSIQWPTEDEYHE